MNRAVKKLMSRKRLPVWRTLLVMATDLMAIGAGCCLAYWLRFYSPLVALIPIQHGYNPNDYIAIMPFIWIIWLAALRFENLYRRRSRVFDFNVVRRIFTGSCLALLVLIALNFYLPLGVYSRVLSLFMAGSVVAALVASRIVLHYLFQWLVLSRGIGQSRTVILGGGPLAEQVYRSLERHPERGMKPVGLILGRSATSGLHLPEGLPVLGPVDDLEALLREHRIDEVILAQPEIDYERIPRLLVECERAMAVFRIVPETTELLLSGMTVETIDGIPLLGIRETPLQGWHAALKRMIDFGVALAGLLVTGPLIGVLAALVRWREGGPAFFVQERMGIDGRAFKIFKLRTMRLDAEQHSGPIFAEDFDPRCTPLGALLRRSHLDELPQLLNVLRGEMSLVGPRPERPHFIDQFRDNVPRYMARHKVKSGITGWAQVNGLCGRHGSIDERLKYDLYYIENWTLLLDFKILMMTLFGRVRPGPV